MIKNSAISLYLLNLVILIHAYRKNDKLEVTNEELEDTNEWLDSTDKTLELVTKKLDIAVEDRVVNPRKSSIRIYFFKQYNNYIV